MPEIDSYNLMQNLGVFGLSLIALVFFGKQIFKGWSSTTAETSLIGLMHTELERMAEQNSSLSIELGRLHSEVIVLNTQLQQLTVENQRLQSEVVVLTREVTRLQAVLYKGDLDGNAN